MTWLRDLLAKWKELAVLAVFFLGLGWSIAKPAAEDFINKSVDGRIIELQGKLAELQLSLDSQKTTAMLAQTRTESDLASTKAILQELLDLELHRTQP